MVHLDFINSLFKEGKKKPTKKCCLTFSKYRKIMKENSKKFEKTPSLFYFYETILYDIKQRNNISNCSVCSRPTFVREIMYSVLTPNGKMISPEMTLSEKEKFRQCLKESY